jgi:hypothetical protein
MCQNHIFDKLTVLVISIAFQNWQIPSKSHQSTSGGFMVG